MLSPYKSPSEVQVPVLHLTVRVRTAMRYEVGRKVNVQALTVVGRGRAIRAQRMEEELLVKGTASRRTPMVQY